jgi:hypothetical protein
LALPVNYGRIPSIQPFPEDCKASYERWMNNEDRKAEQRHLLRIKDEVDMILGKMDERRERLVQEIRMVPKPGAVAGMVKAQRRVSPYVKSLNIEDLPYDSVRQHSHYRHIREKEFLDVKLLSAKLSLPSLTSFHAGNCALRHEGVLALICNAAPNLTTVVVDISATHHSQSTGQSDFHRYLDRPK